MRSFVLVLPMCLGLWLGAWSCGPSHCGYNAGDATCAGRGASAPYCNLCVSDNDGCVATPPSDAGCVLVTDSGLFDPTVEPPPGTEGTTAAPTGPGPGPSSATSEPPPQTETSTSTSTTTPVDTDMTSSSTTDVTTEMATGPGETTVEATSTGESSETTGTSTGESSESGESTSTGTTADESTGPPPPMCGNGVLEEMEACDGAALADQECVDFPGKGGGTLACTQMCQFDLAGCCLANGQACNADAECCVDSCKFDLLMLKNICKP